MDQKTEDQLRETLVLDRGKIADLSDESLENRIRSLTEVLAGYDSKDKEGEAFRRAVDYFAGHPVQNYRAVLRVLRKERRRRAMTPNRQIKVVPWTPFQRAGHPDPAEFETPEAWARYERLAAQDLQGRTAQDYHDIYLSAANDEIYVNSRYQVAVRRDYADDGMGGIMEMVHLSIKRRDQQVVHDWRDLQRIKNELVGEECEGVELYPAESRVIDTANQYHLWCVNSTSFRWPVGWHQGQLKMDGDASDAAGAGQRPFEVAE